MKFFLLITALLLGISPALAAPLTVTWLEMPVHGLAVVVQTPAGKVWLVDTGGVRAEPAHDGGRDVIAPFLKERGLTEIEGIVISSIVMTRQRERTAP